MIKSPPPVNANEYRRFTRELLISDTKISPIAFNTWKLHLPHIPVCAQNCTSFFPKNMGRSVSRSTLGLASGSSSSSSHHPRGTNRAKLPVKEAPPNNGEEILIELSPWHSCKCAMVMHSLWETGFFVVAGLHC